MAFAAWWGILNLVLTVALLAAVVYLFVLIARALKKYISSKEVRVHWKRNPTTCRLCLGGTFLSVKRLDYKLL